MTVMTTDEILEGLLASVPDGYDTSAGSFFYDALAPAAEWLYYLQASLVALTDNAFALTAAGEYLERKCAEQGIERKAATYATGYVTIYGKAGEVINSGAKVASSVALFAVDEGGSVGDDGCVTLAATALTAGTAGNAASGEITLFPISYPNLTAVTNDEAFTGGAAAETDDELRARYIEKVSKAAASGSKYNYIEWAESVEGVGSAQCIPLWDGAGTVKVIITGAGNAAASDELCEAVAEYIEENRPIGAEVTVVSADVYAVNISVAAVYSGDGDLAELIADAVGEYLTNEAYGRGYISYAKIGSVIMTIDGVEDYSDLTVGGGTENITLDEGVLPTVGEVTVL